jgi:hypothetical protein
MQGGMAMFTGNRQTGLVLAAFLVFLLFTQGGCDFFSKPGGSLAVPLTQCPSGKKAGGQTETPARANRSRPVLPAPVRRASVPGGELPAIVCLPGEYSLGKGVTFGAIRIFPVYCNVEQDRGERYLTLAQAQERGEAEITECEDGASVGAVQIVNNSQRSIYVMSGDIIQGGRQDRVIAQDMVIPPGQRHPVEASVFCVERGRWSEGATGGQFTSKEHACFNLRKSLAGGLASQSEVWLKVDEINAAFGTGSATSMYSRALEDSSVATRVNQYTRAFLREFGRDEKAIGFTVCAGKKVVGFEVFLNPSLLSTVREKVIKSYVMGIMSTGERPGKLAVEADDIAEFLSNIEVSQIPLQERDDNCQTTVLESSGIQGFLSGTGNKKIHLFISNK